MANAIYPSFKQWLWTGGTPLAGTIKATLLDLAFYSYSAAHQFYSDVPSSARLSAAGVGHPSAAGATLFGDNALFSSAAGPPAGAIVLWADTSVDTTSHLIVYLDTGIAGLPVTPNGGNIQLSWDVAGIFSL